MVFGQVLQIPQENPIFQRELSNHMYSVSAYWLATWTRAVLCAWFYPVILVTCSFFFFEFEDHSAADLFNYMAACSAVCYSGQALGLFFGSVTSNAEVAMGIANLFAMIAGFGAGCFSNTGSDANPVITFLSWVSPLRYGCELLMREVTKKFDVVAQPVIVFGGKTEQELILEQFGYTYGNAVCYLFLTGFILFFFFFGWFMLWARNRTV